MNWFEAGGAFVVGMVFVWCILSSIYCLFGEPIDDFWDFIKEQLLKIKYALFGEPEVEEPTVCEKSGSGFSGFIYSSRLS